MPPRTRLVGLLLGLAASGCAGAPPPAPVVAPRPAPPPAPVRVPAPPGTFALVWWDAPLHRAPDAASPMIRAYAPLAVRQPGQVQAVRVLADHGPWVEIETGAAGALCHPAAGALAVVRLTLFVRAADITPAIAVGQDLRWPDHTRVAFPAGIHALASGPPVEGVARLLLGGDGVAVPVQLPVADLAPRWSPERGSAWPRAYTLDVEAAPTIGGSPLVDQQRWPGGRVAFCGELVPQRQARAAEGAAPVTPPRARGRRVPSATRLVGPSQTQIVPTRGCPTCVVAAGYRRVTTRLPGPALTWEDGTPAGVSLADVDVHDVAPADPERACFTIAPDPHAAPLHAPAPPLALRLCAPRAALRTPSG